MPIEVGFYLYVGSAFGPGGLRARVGRHLGGQGALRWHIDYLRRVTQPVEAWFCVGSPSCEHAWALALAAAAPYSMALARFGASDCRCPSHLFFMAQPPSPEWLAALLAEVIGSSAGLRLWRAQEQHPALGSGIVKA